MNVLLKIFHAGTCFVAGLKTKTKSCNINKGLGISTDIHINLCILWLLIAVNTGTVCSLGAYPLIPSKPVSCKMNTYPGIDAFPSPLNRYKSYRTMFRYEKLLLEFRTCRSISCILVNCTSAFILDINPVAIYLLNLGINLHRCSLRL